MTSVFDFVRTQGRETSQEIQPEELQEEEVIETPSTSSIFEVAKKAPRLEEKKSFIKEIPRHVARSVSRGAETLAGLPRDALDLQRNLILKGAEGLAQKELPWLRKALDAGQKMLPAYYMSGSQDLKEGANALSRDFLAPQSEGEELADNIVSDAVTLMLPLKTKIPFWKTFLRSGAISGVGNLVGDEVEKQTGSTEAGEYAKLGTMFLTSLMSPKGMQSARQFVGKIYDEARNAISPNAVMPAQKMSRELTGLRTRILAQRTQGTLAPSERFVVDEIDNVLSTVQNGQIPVESAWAAKRSLNEKLEKLIYESPDRKLRARARNLATGINKELNEVLKDYGSQNPAFGVPFNEAEEAFATMAKSRQVSNFVRKNAKVLGTHSGGAILLEVLTGHPVAAGYSLAGIGTAAAINQAATVAIEISKSPALRRHYLNVLKAAAQENAATMNKNLSILQKELDKKGLLDTD